jgi:hypothetical protein
MGYACGMCAQAEESDEVVAGRLRRIWFASLQEISNIDLQRRMWLDVANRNPHWSYIEFVCKYPDADQLADANARGWLHALEFGIMNEFGLVLSDYSALCGDDYNNAAILEDPEWHAVVAAARFATQKVLAVITDESERKTLQDADLR